MGEPVTVRLHNVFDALGHVYDAKKLRELKAVLECYGILEGHGTGDEYSISFDSDQRAIVFGYHKMVRTGVLVGRLHFAESGVVTDAVSPEFRSCYKAGEIDDKAGVAKVEVGSDIFNAFAVLAFGPRVLNFSMSENDSALLSGAMETYECLESGQKRDQCLSAGHDLMRRTRTDIIKKRVVTGGFEE